MKKFPVSKSHHASEQEAFGRRLQQEPFRIVACLDTKVGKSDSQPQPINDCRRKSQETKISSRSCYYHFFYFPFSFFFIFILSANIERLGATNFLLRLFGYWPMLDSSGIFVFYFGRGQDIICLSNFDWHSSLSEVERSMVKFKKEGR